MIELNRLKTNSTELISVITRLASSGLGTLKNITLNFEGLAIVEFTTKKGFTEPQIICETLDQGKKGQISPLENLDSVTIKMTVDINEESADVGIDLTFPYDDKPTLLYVDTPKMGFLKAQHITLFRIYEALHASREELPHPTEKPGSDAVVLLDCLRQKLNPRAAQ